MVDMLNTRRVPSSNSWGLGGSEKAGEFSYEARKDRKDTYSKTVSGESTPLSTLFTTKKLWALLTPEFSVMAKGTHEFRQQRQAKPGTYDTFEGNVTKRAPFTIEDKLSVGL